MKTEIAIANARAALNLPSLITAPSLRVPVTARNRGYLRRLRAAELCAWHAADRSARPPTISPWLGQRSCAA